MASYHFLYFNFLKRAKPASSGLHMKCAMDSVLFALVYVLAVKDGHKCLVGYILKSL